MGLEPRLAKNMGTWNQNGNEWTIPLREDVKFHDGTPLSAEHVKWNWDRINALATNVSSSYYAVKRLNEPFFNDDKTLILNRTEIIDEYTIKFVLNKPWMDFFYLQSLTACSIIKPVEGKETKLFDIDEFDLIKGTGPFILQNYIPDKKIELRANHEYYRGPPDIQKLVFQIFESPTAYNDDFLAKKCHVIPYLRYENYEVVTSDNSLEYKTRTYPRLGLFQFNINNIPWAARKAMQYAFSMSALTGESRWANMYLNLSIQANHPIPKGMVGHNPELPGLPYYNLTLARQFLMDDLYFHNLIEERIVNTSDTQAWIDCAENNPLAVYNCFTEGYGTSFLQESMQKIGFSIVDNTIPTGFFYTDMWKEDLEIIETISYSLNKHPINTLEQLYRTNVARNYSGLANASIDVMMDEAHLLKEDDLAKKIDEIVKALIVDQAAALYFGQSQNAFGWNSKCVSNIQDLQNPNKDNYFYHIYFDSVDAGIQISIPGFSLSTLFLSILAFSGILYRLNRKSRLFS
jgi:ABC-type transport system substrate-binding protein